MNKQRRILIIDDEKDILYILEELLETHGFAVQTAINGEQGVELFKSSNFDLVITDIHMPGMDGLEVIKLINELDPYVEIIVLTGYASVNIAIKALKAGRAFDLFNKPIGNYDTLFNTIGQAIEKRNLKIRNELLFNEVKRHRDNLEQLVFKRTSELEKEIAERKKAETELIKAKETAESANMAKSQFIARISHELRTPMNAIIGMAQLTMETSLDSNQSEYLNNIWKSANHLLSIINEILDFSQLIKNKYDIELIEFKLDNVLNNILAPYIKKAQEKQIPIMLTIDKSIPQTLIGDKIKFKRIIAKLLDNAVKFTEKGKILVKANLLKIDSDDKAELIISIVDTGIGIEEEKLSEIFEPFTQADGSLSRAYEGTGIGLSLCRQMAEILGGRLWVDSLKGHGSSFMFTAKFDYMH